MNWSLKSGVNCFSSLIGETQLERQNKVAGRSFPPMRLGEGLGTQNGRPKRFHAFVKLLELGFA